MKVREARKEDISFLLQGFKETHANILHADSEGYKQRLLSDVLSANPKAKALIFEEDGDSVGYILYADSYFASTGSVFWVSQAYVDPEYRGRVFRNMVRELKKYATNQNVSHFVWCTEIGNRRLGTLWLKGGAKSLNQDFSFWSLKTSS